MLCTTCGTRSRLGFGINLDPGSLSRPPLGMAIMRAYVRALEDIGRRNEGHAVETPKVTQGTISAPVNGGTLRDAFEGWKLARSTLLAPFTNTNAP
jgi:hypothetical protein